MAPEWMRKQRLASSNRSTPLSPQRRAPAWDWPRSTALWSKPAAAFWLIPAWGKERPSGYFCLESMKLRMCSQSRQLPPSQRSRLGPSCWWKTNWGYTVLLAENGMDALDVAARHKGPIQLLITDVIMPSVSGPQLAQSLKTLRPETRVLYISGYTADKFADYPELDPELALLQKPFKLVDLGQKVRDVLNAEDVSAKQTVPRS